jgi:DNA-binding NarL/FixJ family response regulator
VPKTPRHHRQGWTPAEERQLRELARGNTPTRVIGVKLGRTEDAVRTHASQIGQSLRPTNQSPYGRGGKKRK